MFRNALQYLPEPLKFGSARASLTGSAWRWTIVAVALALLFIGLDNTILELSLPLPDQQPGAEDSALRWMERAKAIGSWSGTAAAGIGFGPVAGLLVMVGTRRIARSSSSSA
jgi:hypothetical protein